MGDTQTPAGNLKNIGDDTTSEEGKSIYYSLHKS